MVSGNGFGQEADQTYDDTFASLDTATAILDILYRHDPLSEETQGEGRDDVYLQDELDQDDQAPQAPT